MPSATNKLLSILNKEEKNKKKFPHLQPIIQLFISDVLSWPETEKANHSYGGTEFRLFNRSIGHIHSNGILDMPFVKELRRELLDTGIAQLHHLEDTITWVSKPIASELDIPAAKELMLLSYWIKGRDYFDKSPKARDFILEKLSDCNFPASIFAIVNFNSKHQIN
ncbi:MAG: luciferase family protein [Bacteroidia bacterium]